MTWQDRLACTKVDLRQNKQIKTTETTKSTVDTKLIDNLMDLTWCYAEINWKEKLSPFTVGHFQSKHLRRPKWTLFFCSGPREWGYSRPRLATYCLNFLLLPLCRVHVGKLLPYNGTNPKILFLYLITFLRKSDEFSDFWTSVRILRLFLSPFAYWSKKCLVLVWQ